MGPFGVADEVEESVFLAVEFCEVLTQGGAEVPDPSLMDLRTFVLLFCAAGTALLLYYKPAAGLALLGGVAVLRALIHLVGRTQ